MPTSLYSERLGAFGKRAGTWCENYPSPVGDPLRVMNHGNVDFLDGMRRDRSVAGRLGIGERLAKHQKLRHETGMDSVDRYAAAYWPCYLGYCWPERCCDPADL